MLFSILSIIVAIICVAIPHELLTSRLYDRIRYLERIRYCCFPSILGFDEEDELLVRRRIMEYGFIFNKVLDEHQQITIESDFDVFVSSYRKYRDWLLRVYFEWSGRFAVNYNNCFLRRNRKKYNIQEFVNIFGAVSEKTLFLAQTYEYYSSRKFQQYPISRITTTECKMRLGALLMLEIIGFNKIYEIDDLKEEIEKRKKDCGSK